MTKKKSQLAALIQTARGNNYANHYETRAIVKTMPADLIAEFADVALLSVPFPILNIVGTTFDGWMPANVDKLLRKLWTPNLIHIFNPWYLSEDGWDGFQVLWKAMPEPEQMPADLLITLITSHSSVDKSVKSVDNLLKACAQPADNLASYPQAEIPIRKIRPVLRKLSTPLWISA